MVKKCMIMWGRFVVLIIRDRVKSIMLMVELCVVVYFLKFRLVMIWFSFMSSGLLELVCFLKRFSVGIGVFVSCSEIKIVGIV